MKSPSPQRITQQGGGEPAHPGVTKAALKAALRQPRRGGQWMPGATELIAALGITRRRVDAPDQQRATQYRIRMFCPGGRDAGARAGVSTRRCGQIMPTADGTDEPDWRGVKRAKVVPRSRFNPTFLNALSSSTVEPRSSRRIGTDSWSACIGTESGPADEPAIWGCEALDAISARKAPQPRTAATRASTATMASADCPGDHREGIPTPKLTVPCTLPAEFGHQSTRDVLQNQHRNGPGMVPKWSKWNRRPPRNRAQSVGVVRVRPSAVRRNPERRPPGSVRTR